MCCRRLAGDGRFVLRWKRGWSVPTEMEGGVQELKNMQSIRPAERKPMMMEEKRAQGVLDSRRCRKPSGGGRWCLEGGGEVEFAEGCALTKEDWRGCRSRREVGSKKGRRSFGCTGQSWRSGEKRKEEGEERRGRRRIEAVVMMVFPVGSAGKVLFMIAANSCWEH